MGLCILPAELGGKRTVAGEAQPGAPTNLSRMEHLLAPKKLERTHREVVLRAGKTQNPSTGVQMKMT